MGLDMAAVQDFIKSISGADEKAAQTKEKVDLLVNAAKANLTIAENELAAP
jgi:hypothetical protein